MLLRNHLTQTDLPRPVRCFSLAVDADGSVQVQHGNHVVAKEACTKLKTAVASRAKPQLCGITEPAPPRAQRFGATHLHHGPLFPALCHQRALRSSRGATYRGEWILAELLTQCSNTFIHLRDARLPCWVGNTLSRPKARKTAQATNGERNDELKKAPVPHLDRLKVRRTAEVGTPRC